MGTNECNYESRLFKKYEKNATRMATAAQRTKAFENVPVVSLIQPPTKGAKTSGR